MKVVLDTNVVVSALLEPRGHPATVLVLAVRGDIKMYISAAVLAEYEEVLRRPRFEKLGAAAARLVKPARTLKISPDEADNRLYECAEAARADFLVTGNCKHFPAGHRKTQIVTPRELLDLLDLIP
jgi:uncharacterized protein